MCMKQKKSFDEHDIELQYKPFKESLAWLQKVHFDDCDAPSMKTFFINLYQIMNLHQYVN